MQEADGLEDASSLVCVDGMLVGTIGVLVLLTETFEYAWERPVRWCGVWGASMRRLSPSRGLFCSQLMFERPGVFPILGVMCLFCILEPWPSVGWSEGCFMLGRADVVEDVLVLALFSPW